MCLLFPNTVALFTFISFIQMTIWAREKHQIYSREFLSYPELRSAIIPLFLWASQWNGSTARGPEAMTQQGNSNWTRCPINQDYDKTLRIVSPWPLSQASSSGISGCLLSVVNLQSCCSVLKYFWTNVKLRMAISRQCSADPLLSFNNKILCWSHTLWKPGCFFLFSVIDDTAQII